MDIAEIVQELNRRFALPLKNTMNGTLSSGMTRRKNLPRKLKRYRWIMPRYWYSQERISF